MKKNILFITTEVWSNSPEGIVVKKYIKGLEENKFGVDIVTNFNIDYESGEQIILENNIGEFIDKVLKRITGLEKIGFILKFIRESKKKIDFNKYTIVIVRSEPISLQLISLYLKKKYPKLKIIASFSDIGYLNPYYKKINFFKKIISRIIEKKVFSTVEMVTHTNKFVFEKYSQVGIEPKKKFILENPLELGSGNIRRKKVDSNINIAYIGSFYGGRTPEALFKYIAKIDDERRVKIYIIGGVRNIYYSERLGKIGKILKKRELNKIYKLAEKYKIKKQIEIIPFMNSMELDKYVLERIDILVNIDLKTKGKNVFLSSKIVDYLKYDLPILNFSNEGASVEFLKSVGINYYIDYENEKNSFNILKDNLNDLIPEKTKIENYLSKNLMKKMIMDIQYNEEKI